MNTNQKKYIVNHYDRYGFDFNNPKEMIALLNILQAGGECLDSLHDAIINGKHEFMDIFHNGNGWESDQELYETLLQFNAFYTDEEFIQYILDRISDMKDDGVDYAEEIRH